MLGSGIVRGSVLSQKVVEFTTKSIKGYTKQARLERESKKFLRAVRSNYEDSLVTVVEGIRKLTDDELDEVYTVFEEHGIEKALGRRLYVHVPGED